MPISSKVRGGKGIRGGKKGRGEKGGGEKEELREEWSTYELNPRHRRDWREEEKKEKGGGGYVGST